jgi:hypothetical protein
MCKQSRSLSTLCVALFLTASTVFQAVPIIGAKRITPSDPILTAPSGAESQRVNNQSDADDGPLAPLAATVTASLTDDITSPIGSTRRHDHLRRHY